MARDAPLRGGYKKGKLMGRQWFLLFKQFKKRNPTYAEYIRYCTGTYADYLKELPCYFAHNS